MTKKVANLIILSPTSEIGLHHKITNVTLSPTSLSPILTDDQSTKFWNGLTQDSTRLSQIGRGQPQTGTVWWWFVPSLRALVQRETLTSGKAVNYQTYNRHQVSRCGLNHLVNWSIEVNRAILFEDGLKSILFLAVYKLNEGRPINSKSL